MARPQIPGGHVVPRSDSVARTSVLARGAAWRLTACLPDSLLVCTLTAFGPLEGPPGEPLCPLRGYHSKAACISRHHIISAHVRRFMPSYTQPTKGRILLAPPLPLVRIPYSSCMHGIDSLALPACHVSPQMRLGNWNPGNRGIRITGILRAAMMATIQLRAPNCRLSNPCTYPSRTHMAD